jgi:hypothetical protein
MRVTSCYPQTVDLDENARLQIAIIYIISKICYMYNQFCVAAGANGYMVEIMWHRRETRLQVEKTNVN